MINNVLKRQGTKDVRLFETNIIKETSVTEISMNSKNKVSIDMSNFK